MVTHLQTEPLLDWTGSPARRGEVIFVQIEFSVTYSPNVYPSAYLEAFQNRSSRPPPEFRPSTPSAASQPPSTSESDRATLSAWPLTRLRAKHSTDIPRPLDLRPPIPRRNPDRPARTASSQQASLTNSRSKHNHLRRYKSATASTKIDAKAHSKTASTHATKAADQANKKEKTQQDKSDNKKPDSNHHHLLPWYARKNSDYEATPERRQTIRFVSPSPIVAHTGEPRVAPATDSTPQPSYTSNWCDAMLPSSPPHTPDVRVLWKLLPKMHSHGRFSGDEVMSWSWLSLKSSAKSRRIKDHQHHCHDDHHHHHVDKQASTPPSPTYSAPPPSCSASFSSTLSATSQPTCNTTTPVAPFASMDDNVRIHEPDADVDAHEPETEAEADSHFLTDMATALAGVEWNSVSAPDTLTLGAKTFESSTVTPVAELPGEETCQVDVDPSEPPPYTPRRVAERGVEDGEKPAKILNNNHRVLPLNTEG